MTQRQAALTSDGVGCRHATAPLSVAELGLPFL
jgi:hypothetical protein